MEWILKVIFVQLFVAFFIRSAQDNRDFPCLLTSRWETKTLNLKLTKMAFIRSPCVYRAGNSTVYTL